MEREWVVRGAGDIEAAVERAAIPLRLRCTRGADGLELRGGSQLKMRLIGSILSKGDILPRQGLLQRSPVAGDPGAERVTLRLEDTFGFGLLDPVTKRRYERVFDETVTAIEAAVTGAAAAVTVADAPAAQAVPSPEAATDDEAEWATVVPEDGTAPAMPAPTAPAAVEAPAAAAPPPTAPAAVEAPAAAPPAPPAPTAPAAVEVPAAAAAAPSTAEELERLASLRERGLLTDDEFNAAKAKLLS